MRSHKLCFICSCMHTLHSCLYHNKRILLIWNHITIAQHWFYIRISILIYEPWRQTEIGFIPSMREHKSEFDEHNKGTMCTLFGWMYLINIWKRSENGILFRDMWILKVMRVVAPIRAREFVKTFGKLLSLFSDRPLFLLPCPSSPRNFFEECSKSVHMYWLKRGQKLK